MIFLSVNTFYSIALVHISPIEEMVIDIKLIELSKYNSVEYLCLFRLSLYMPCEVCVCRRFGMPESPNNREIKRRTDERNIRNTGMYRIIDV